MLSNERALNKLFVETVEIRIYEPSGPYLSVLATLGRYSPVFRVHKSRLSTLFMSMNVPDMYNTSEGMFYIGGRGFVCQFIEPVTFALRTFTSRRTA